MADRVTPRRSQHRCVICGKSVSPDEPDFPFCSERCRTRDLANWRDEKYVISRPIEQSDLDEGE